MPDRIIQTGADTPLTNDELLERLRLALAFSNMGESTWDVATDAVNLSKLEAWIPASGKARYGANGDVLGMIGVLQDVTSRKLEQMWACRE